MPSPARSLLVGLALALMTSSASAQPFRGPLQWRPCGPGDTATGNQCAPQTYRGVDLRPACQAHDNCYGSKSGTQKECDLRFRDDLRALCDAGGNPCGCYRRAQILYLAVRIGGKSAYEKAKPE